MSFCLEKISLCAATAVLLCSCATSKQLTYMQDLVAGESFVVEEAPEIAVRAADKLKIVVSCKNPQLAVPFNLVGCSYSMNTDGVATAQSDDEQGYEVTAEGFIEFPVLGNLQVAGMTLSEIKKMICDLLVTGNYIKDPIVTVDFMNFKYTILGEVGSKGNKTVKGNHINLIQAIAESGDLTTAANYGDVKVIRTRQGKREVYSVNMYTKDLYNSPAFYLQQDDVVYVKPRGSKLTAGGDLAFKITTISLSSISVLTTTAILLYNLYRDNKK